MVHEDGRRTLVLCVLGNEIEMLKSGLATGIDLAAMGNPQFDRIIVDYCESFEAFMKKSEGLVTDQTVVVDKTKEGTH